MAKKHLAVILINQKDKLYRFNTISISNDGSIHIIANIPENKPFKGTYHPSGFTHFTNESNDGRQEVFPKWRKKHSEVAKSEGLMNFTIKDINKKVETFDEFTKLDKYKNIIKINPKKYTHLTVQYFLASKDFDTSKSSHLYSEVFEIELDNNKLIIATKDSTDILDIIKIYTPKN
ncbi:MAG TPA: hypothetical protein VK153_02365 [Candidatus Paceibacterota bacterium]|nr:hypothetical protein [Candidatus Paceibacterota bacterium]